MKSQLNGLELFFSRQIQKQSIVWKILTFIPAKLFQCVLFIKAMVFKCHLIPLYHPKQLTMCIGNITLGGNGKTPFLMKLARDLQDCHPTIFSKGYKRKSKESFRVTSKSDPIVVGDEPLMLSQTFPNMAIYVGNSRKAFLEQSKSSLILFDDGLQEKSIDYAYKIAVFDKRYFQQTSHYFPMGNLRDLEKALQSVQLCAVKGELSHNEFEEIQAKCKKLTQAPISSFELAFESIQPFNNHLFSFKEKVAAFCGIGYPENFYDSLRNAGLQIEKTYALPDHEVFEEEALVLWMESCMKEGIDQIVCTQKDAVKLNPKTKYPCGLFIFEVACKLVHGKEHYATLLLKMRKDLEKQQNQLS